MKKFILPENARSNVINGHVFKDGVLFASDDDAKRLKNTLCRYYGVTMEDVEVSEPEDGSEDDSDSSLTVDNTQKGATVEEEEEEEEEDE